MPIQLKEDRHGNFDQNVQLFGTLEDISTLTLTRGHPWSRVFVSKKIRAGYGSRVGIASLFCKVTVARYQDKQKRPSASRAALVFGRCVERPAFLEFSLYGDFLSEFAARYDPGMKLLVTLNRDETRMVVAECPAIPGCMSQGASEAVALANIREAIVGCCAARSVNRRYL